MGKINCNINCNLVWELFNYFKTNATAKVENSIEPVASKVLKDIPSTPLPKLPEQNGRYQMQVVNANAFSHIIYLIDTQSGRIWADSCHPNHLPFPKLNYT